MQTGVRNNGLQRMLRILIAILLVLSTIPISLFASAETLDGAHPGEPEGGAAFSPATPTDVVPGDQSPDAGPALPVSTATDVPYPASLVLIGFEDASVLPGRRFFPLDGLFAYSATDPEMTPYRIEVASIACNGEPLSFDAMVEDFFTAPEELPDGEPLSYLITYALYAPGGIETPAATPTRTVTVGMPRMLRAAPMTVFDMQKDKTWGTFPYYSLQVLNQRPGTLPLYELLEFTKTYGGPYLEDRLPEVQALKVIKHFLDYYGQPFGIEDEPAARYAKGKAGLDAMMDILKAEHGADVIANTPFLCNETGSLLTAKNAYINGNVVEYNPWPGEELFYDIDISIAGDIYRMTDQDDFVLSPGVKLNTKASEDPAAALIALSEGLAAPAASRAYPIGTIEDAGGGSYILNYNASSSNIITFDWPDSTLPFKPFTFVPRYSEKIMVINVPGKAVTLDMLDHMYLPTDEAGGNNVVFNFYEAELLFGGHYAYVSSILAPKADFFSTLQPQVSGYVAVNSVTLGLGQMAVYEPEPAGYPYKAQITKTYQDTVTPFTYYLYQITEWEPFTCMIMPAAGFELRQSDGSVSFGTTDVNGAFTLYAGQTATFYIYGDYAVWEAYQSEHEYQTKIYRNDALVDEEIAWTHGKYGAGACLGLQGSHIYANLDFYNYHTESLTIQKTLDEELLATHADTAFRFKLFSVDPITDAETLVTAPFTDENGWFSLKSGEKTLFGDLPAGTYRLEEEAYTDTQPEFVGLTADTTTSVLLTLLADAEQTVTVKNVPVTEDPPPEPEPPKPEEPKPEPPKPEPPKPEEPKPEEPKPPQPVQPAPPSSGTSTGSPSPSPNPNTSGTFVPAGPQPQEDIPLSSGLFDDGVPLGMPNTGTAQSSVEQLLMVLIAGCACKVVLQNRKRGTGGTASGGKLS